MRYCTSNKIERMQQNNPEVGDKRVKRSSIWTILVIICLLVVTAGTALANTTDKVDSFLNNHWKEYAGCLKPVQMSCDKAGIRIEVISAGVKDGKTLLVFSLQDLEGDRIDEDTRTVLYDDLGGYEGAAAYMLEYDEAAHKGIYAEEIRHSKPVQPGTNGITFSMKNLQLTRHSETDLIPLVKQYGKNAGGVMPPEDLPVWCDLPGGNQSDRVPDLKVLDYTHPLNIPLRDNLMLTGAGWIDGLLHVQIHHMDRPPVSLKNSCQDPLVFSLCDDIYTERKDRLPEGIRRLSWDENGDRAADWYEYLFACGPEEMDRFKIVAEIQETLGVLEEKWEIRIPADTIMDS